jgi:hypothetical protein
MIPPMLLRANSASPACALPGTLRAFALGATKIKAIKTT